VYLVWLGTVQPYPKLLLESEDQVDRIMIDSRICQKPMDFYKDLRDHGHWDSMAYTDLAWGRIAPLLRATALLFNPYDLREKLQAVTEIHFTGGQIAEALLFFLWFSSKMGYKLITSGASQWEFAREDEKLVAKHSGAQDLEEGFGITFMTSAGKPLLSKARKRDTSSRPLQARTAIPPSSSCPRIVTSFLSEVDRTGQDRLYSGSIHKI
jgi:glucose-6-phosphate dehydrogenase assembly protein OpcA